MFNGKTKVIFLLASTMITLVLFIALPTMANAIITNDKDSRSRDAEIQAKIADFRVEQMRQGTILEQIERKL